MFKSDFDMPIWHCPGNRGASHWGCGQRPLWVGGMQKTSTKTLYDYWNRLRGARSAPDRRDIDPSQIKSALANTFILELDEANEFSFRLAGSHLCTAYARELKGRSFTRIWHPRDRYALGTLIRAVTEDHAVALVTVTGTTPINTQTSFETILLPIRPNEASAGDMARDIATSIAEDLHDGEEAMIAPMRPMAATVFGRSARRYAHLAVIDGGRPR